MKIFKVALGILAAIGGFVDIGDLVFNVAAGATFGYQLLWVVVIGVIGIIVYSEMCGRVAAVSARPSSTRSENASVSRPAWPLVSAQVVNLLTLAAEIGGLGDLPQLLSGLPYRVLILARHRRRSRSSSGSLPFDWIERIFGYGGLCMLVFAVAAREARIRTGARSAHGFVPHLRRRARCSTPTSPSACWARR